MRGMITINYSSIDCEPYLNVAAKKYKKIARWLRFRSCINHIVASTRNARYTSPYPSFRAHRPLSAREKESMSSQKWNIVLINLIIGANCGLRRCHCESIARTIVQNCVQTVVIAELWDVCFGCVFLHSLRSFWTLTRCERLCVLI